MNSPLTARLKESERLPIRYWLEIGGWASIALVTWAISAQLELFELLVEFSRAHQEWQVDEVFSLIIILSITSFVASLGQARYQSRCRHSAERAASRDVLTDLPNRRMFAELAGKALGIAWRKGGRCAVLFIDLDGFKPVNDTYGHIAGDRLLVAVADLLRRELPDSALPARIGGDEFAVLLCGVVDDDAVSALAEDLIAKLQQPIRVADYEIRIGATIGVAIGPDAGRRADDLIHAADTAMYQAKRARKGSVRVYGTEPRGELVTSGPHTLTGSESRVAGA